MRTDLKKVSIFRRASSACSSVEKNDSTLFIGDAVDLLRRVPDESVSLIITSPPYCIGKSYEKGKGLDDFLEVHRRVIPECARVLKPGGSICWQTGYHVSKSGLEPLDYHVHTFATAASLSLRNRIIWSFGHGPHASQRFSGRHEVIMWYVKPGPVEFNLDSIRIPQIYPGKRHYKGPKKGSYSGHPLGKNPGDLWEFPSVKAGHVEKSIHPCQFPVALAQRLVKALTSPGDLVMDPFMGAGTVGVAAALDRRKFLGSEIESDYVAISQERIAAALRGEAKYRPIDQPPYKPKKSDPIERLPLSAEEA